MYIGHSWTNKAAMIASPIPFDHEVDNYIHEHIMGKDNYVIVVTTLAFIMLFVEKAISIAISPDITSKRASWKFTW